ncbi:MAG TPA: aldehyde dehydrogenase family protein [Candidatus Methanomethylophilaceae archaeon]|nr:aldehyde dehydrogenase family protein [Candidatus Methanomethylophilaceae archaeon]
MSGPDDTTQTVNEDTLFQRAFDGILSMEKKGYPSFIDGIKVASYKDYELTSPIDSAIIFGKFQVPEEGTATVAVDAAKKAFDTWSLRTHSERKEIFLDVLKRVKAQRYRLAANVMISTGMTVKDCLAEADRLAEMIEDACNTDEKGKPMGVWGTISEHSSPLASPAGAASYAMVAGNTIVALPSMMCPMPMFAFSNILQAAGLPGGVFNITVSKGHETDRELTDDLSVRGLAVSGGGDRIDELMFLPVDRELRFIGEIKGMNPILVYKPGNMASVADSITESSFRSAGQRLQSCSKVIVTDSDKSKLISALRESAKSIVVGDPAELNVTSGPLMSREDLDNFKNYAEKAKDKIVYGGEMAKGPYMEGGFYVVPMIVTGPVKDCELGHFDTGLPILTIISVPNMDDMLEELLNTECGLSASLFSKDDNLIKKFKEYAEAPFLNINEGTENMMPGMVLGSKGFRD